MKLIDADELYNIIKLMDTDIIRKSKTASFLLDQVLYDIEASSTAFDKEKVKAQLQGNVVIGADCIGEGFECVPAFKALEIIEKGGIGDDEEKIEL